MAGLSAPTGGGARNASPARPPGGRWPRALVWGVVLVVQVLIGFALAEFGIRMLKPGLIHRPDPIRHTFWSHDPELGWTNRPSDDGIFEKAEFKVHVTTNSMGFRDRERPRESAEGSPPGGHPFRLAVFGDSTTWGHGVEDEEVYTRLLGQALPEVDVWNFGVAAYATDQELLLFRKVAPAVRPDLVLVMMDRNDFEGVVSDHASIYAKPWFVEEGGELKVAGVPVPDFSWWDRTWTDIRRRSVVLYSIWYLLGGRWPDLPREEPPGQIRMMRRILDQFREEASGIGAEFAVGLVPSVQHVYVEEMLPVERDRREGVLSWGEERGVRVFDLVPAFRQAFASTGRWYHFKRDTHWNAAGHALAAETLAPLLRESGLLPPPR